jgi:hypothetical protein
MFSWEIWNKLMCSCHINKYINIIVTCRLPSFLQPPHSHTSLSSSEPLRSVTHCSSSRATSDNVLTYCTWWQIPVPVTAACRSTGQTGFNYGTQCLNMTVSKYSDFFLANQQSCKFSELLSAVQVRCYRLTVVFILMNFVNVFSIVIRKLNLFPT